MMLKTVSSITNAIGALNFKGTWNAATNTPTIVSGVGVKGDYFVVSVAGSTTIDGISNWGVGDWITYNGTVWQRVEGGADLNGVNLTVTNTTTLSGLTASTALALDATKNVVSVANTGTGDNVLATSPTLVTPILGTPQSGTVTNLTGTASININGTVGATTPATGAFTTLAASSTATFAAGAVGTPSITTTGDTNTGIFFPAADTIAFAEGGAEAMRIDSSGRVLVGTTTQLGFGITVRPFVSAGGTTSQIYWNRSSTASNGSVLSFNNDGTEVGAITHTNTATTYGTSSDYRLKENVAPMTGALATVAQLNPVTYTWKVDGSSSQGFIAHEVQEIAPYAVSGNKDDVNKDGSVKAQGVDYGKLTPILTAALQEAIAKIETLEARIAVLEAK
jgi:hypothetical protein